VSDRLTTRWRDGRAHAARACPELPDHRQRSDAIMNRLTALFRSWTIPCAGRDVYYTRHRVEWLGKIREAGVRRRAEQLYQQMDMLQHLRLQARRELLAESRKHCSVSEWSAAVGLGRSDVHRWYGFPTPVRCKPIAGAWCENGAGSESVLAPERSEWDREMESAVAWR
jgi:hypothetical protein